MDNRETILNTALELFCNRGYDAVGVQEIVDKAGVTKPTLYYYFGSKQGLLREILNENSMILEDMLQEMIKLPGELPDVLYRVAKAYFEFAWHHWEFYLFMVSQLHSGRETEGFQAVHPLIVKYYQFVVQIFEKISHKLGNMRGRQAQFAVSFMGMLDSHMIKFKLYDYDETKNQDITVSEENMHEIVNQFLYGIYS